MAINEFIDKITNKFNETIFYKRDSELEYQIQAINNILQKYPNDTRLLKKLKLCELGLQGEKEIEFELKNSGIGMYVLHDVNLEYEDLKAQIDYIVLTQGKTYFIECKNLIGNITIDNKGNFVREYFLGNKKIKEGFYSPITQSKRHLEVFKKIWKQRNTSFLDQNIRYKNIDLWYEPIVVLANSKNIINDRYATKDVKNMVLKSDHLINKIRKDLNEVDKDLLSTKKQLHDKAYSLMQNYNKEVERDYEKELEEWINKSNVIHGSNKKPNIEDLNKYNTLIEYRKNKSKEKNIPAYYIFNNEELERILELSPKSLLELNNSHILSDVKLKLHGQEIVDIINRLN